MIMKNNIRAINHLDQKAADNMHVHVCIVLADLDLQYSCLRSETNNLRNEEKRAIILETDATLIFQLQTVGLAIYNAICFNPTRCDVIVNVKLYIWPQALPRL